MYNTPGLIGNLFSEAIRIKGGDLEKLCKHVKNNYIH